MSEDYTKIDAQFDPTTQRMSGTTYHGGIYFDIPFISEIAPNLWQGGCETGLILPKFIKHWITLYPWELYTIKHELDSKLIVRMYDSLDQDTDQIELLAQWVNNCRKSGVTLISCQAGLNRSSLVAAKALMLEGMTADKAIALLREKRSGAVLCNEAFEEWLRK